MRTANSHQPWLGLKHWKCPELIWLANLQPSNRINIMCYICSKSIPALQSAFGGHHSHHNFPKGQFSFHKTVKDLTYCVQWDHVKWMTNSPFMDHTQYRTRVMEHERIHIGMLYNTLWKLLNSATGGGWSLFQLSDSRFIWQGLRTISTSESWLLLQTCA